MLILPNVTMEPSNVRNKIRETTNMKNLWLHVILVLPNVMMKSSNVSRK